MRGILIAASAFVLAGCGVEQIDTGHRGVRMTFGEVDETSGSMKEGLYFYNPFTSSIIEMDARIQLWNAEGNTYTKDVQQANIKYAMNFRPDPAHVHTLYKTVGVNWENKLVPPVVSGIMKQIVGTYDAVDLIENRGKATAEIQKAITEALAPRHVIFDRIELVNIQFLKEFEKAVEDKVIAVQRAVEEKNKTVQIQEQAKQTIISAEAAAKSMKIRADALTANAKLVEYEAVQKWDGKLPQYMLGGATPFIQVK
jgi:regulator of protease activity HflC (stomatin/prohibitin superfamily)